MTVDGTSHQTASEDDLMSIPRTNPVQGAHELTMGFPSHTDAGVLTSEALDMSSDGYFPSFADPSFM